MKHVLHPLIAGVAILLAGVSCRSSSPTEEMALDMCRCMQPMANVYQDMEAIKSDPTTMEKMDNLMARLDGQARETESCIDRLEKRYGEALEKEQADIEPQMRKICPEVMDILSRTDLN